MTLVVVLAWRLTRGDRPAPTAYAVPGTRLPYTVEVLNATDVDGLARTITLRLRRAGIDVVSYGAADETGADSTVIFVRSADTAAGAAVREALGMGRIVVEADPRLLLDVTVLLGRDASSPLDRNP